MNTQTLAETTPRGAQTHTETPVALTPVAETNPVAEKTSRGVNALDALRALALLRVFAWHATGYAALTWVAALPVMVLVTGMLTGRSLLHSGVTTVVVRRVRRLIVPFWVFAATAVSAMWVLGGSLPAQVWWWAVPVWDPQGTVWEEGWMSTPLWYVRMLLWLFALLPVLWFAARRAARSAIVVLAGAVVALEVTLGSSWWAVQDIVLFSVFAVAGLGVTAGSIPAFSKRWWPLVPAGAAMASAWVATQGTTGVVNDSHVLHLAVGAATVGLAGVAGPFFSWVARIAPRLVGWFARSSLSVYLWHTTAVFAVLKVSEGWRAGAGQSVWVRLGVAAAGLVLCAAWVPVVVRFEDRAARRDTAMAQTGIRFGVLTLWRPVAIAAVVVVGVVQPAASVASGWQPPIPSQAPEANEFAADVSVEVTMPVIPSTTVVAGRTETKAESKAGQGTKKTPVTTTTVPQGAKRITGAARSIEDVSSWVQEGSEQDVKLRRMVDSYAEQHREAGIGVLVVRLGGGAWYHGSGASPIGIDEPQGLMSLTKSFTGALVLRAFDDGLIKLDQPVGELKAAPWFESTKKTTWLQYLNHASGLVNYRDTAEYAANPDAMNDWEPALRAVQNAGLLFKPGKQIAYSSSNFLVLGVALEQLYGRPIEEQIRTELLAPLKLDAMSVAEPSAHEPNTGTAGMVSTLRELPRWALAMWVDNQVLTGGTAMVQAAVHPKMKVGPGSMGFCPCSSKGVSGYGYSGGSVSLRWYPKERAIVVYASRVSLWGDGVPGRIDRLVGDLLKATRP